MSRHNGPVTYHNVYADKKGNWCVMSTWPNSSRAIADAVAERHINSKYKRYKPQRVAVIRVTWKDSFSKMITLGLPLKENYVEGP